jgi:sulfatase maturation enzyme AslB (radical SAM superfamily)
MKALTLSINPWYYCNFRCNFCYLTEKQLSDKTLLPLETLEQRINEILCVSKIDMVDLYGGEIGLLPKSYVNELKSLLHSYNIFDINVITNLSMINEIITDPDFYISVSYDFDAREDSERVMKNMALLKKPFSILMLATPKLIQKNVDEMIGIFNNLNNLVSVEIKPYSSNQANQLNVSFKDYEEFVKKWLTNKNKKFNFVNRDLLDSVLNKTRSSFSDDHVYITPNGNYGVLEFDLNDNEFFLEYDTLEEYFKWCEKEKNRVSKNKYCKSCEYFGNCLSEHLREVKSLDNSCNGFKLLIDWYKNEVPRN